MPAPPVPVPANVESPPANAEEIAPGLWSKVLTPGGSTESPEPWDVVDIHVTGWTADGTEFTSTREDRQETPPLRVELGTAIQGWALALPTMVVGEARRLWIAEELAYGGQAKGPRGMVVFDVELLGIDRQPKPPEVPDDVGAPPPDAERTPSGLASKVLVASQSKIQPGPTDVVRVHFTGWTASGRAIGSSLTRGAASVVNLGTHPVPGWVEGLLQMRVGEKRRLWIPEHLAYQGRPGKPRGLLVFDVELLEVISLDAPRGVGKASATADLTPSGVFSEVLREGSGSETPSPGASVAVHYAGWGPDGRLLENTYEDGEPATFAMTKLPSGWADVIQQMVVGEKRRAWIPPPVHGPQPGMPDGVWTIDIEMVALRN